MLSILFFAKLVQAEFPKVELGVAGAELFTNSL